MFDCSIEKHSNTYTAMLEKSNFIVQKKGNFILLNISHKDYMWFVLKNWTIFKFKYITVTENNFSRVNHSFSLHSHLIGINILLPY